MWLKKLATHKTMDLRSIKIEMVKWVGKEAHVWIIAMFNCPLQHSLSQDWSMNWIKTYIKGRHK